VRGNDIETFAAYPARVRRLLLGGELLGELSGTTAFRPCGAPGLGRLPDLGFEVALDELRGERHLGIVLGRVFELLQVVQPAVLVDAVDRGD